MLKFALVGCGRISKRHSELLGYNQIKGAELVALCDVSFSKAKRISDLFKISAYDDMDKMMQNETIDVVVVLTPSGLHAKHVINLAKYGKDIIVEKPMALTLDDADAMIEACANTRPLKASLIFHKHICYTRECWADPTGTHP